jgi:hypothetical protein
MEGSVAIGADNPIAAARQATLAAIDMMIFARNTPFQKGLASSHHSMTARPCRPRRSVLRNTQHPPSVIGGVVECHPVETDIRAEC